MHQRSLWQVLATYAVASWAVYQVALGLRDGLGLIDRLPLYAFLLMLVGLPFVTATWFVQRRLHERAAIDPAATAPPASAHLTWRRTLLAGAAAFLVLSVVTVVLTVMHKRGTLFAQGVLDADDPVLLADFTSAPDTALGPVVTEALRADIMQSHSLRLAQPVQINEELQRMSRVPGEALSATVAREVAERAGFKAIISGDVRRVAGAGYLLNARVVSSRDSILAAFTESAKDSTELIPAVYRLSKQMRAKLGESLKSIRAGTPLDRATTASLPALRKYSEALRVHREKSDVVTARELLTQAVALDSTFASAWRMLSALSTDPAVKEHAATRAYTYRDRLPDAERYKVIGTYQSIVKRDRAAAIQAYQQAVELDSLDLVSWVNLASHLNEDSRYGEAEVVLKRVVSTPGHSASNWVTLALLQRRQGKVDSASATLNRAIRDWPDNPTPLMGVSTLASADGKWETVDSVGRALLTRFPDNRSAREAAYNIQRTIALAHGRLADYHAVQKPASVVAVDTTPAFRLRAALWEGRFSLFMRNDSVRAKREVDAALRTASPVALQHAGNDWLAATTYAMAGYPDLAEPIIRAGEARNGTAWWAGARALYLIAKGDGRAALALARQSGQSTGSCLYCWEDVAGDAFRVMGQRDSARAAYERYLSSPEQRFSEVSVRPRDLIIAASMHEEAGDTASAVRRYLEFIQLWEYADAEFQPRVEAARKRLIALRRPG